MKKSNSFLSSWWLNTKNLVRLLIKVECLSIQLTDWTFLLFLFNLFCVHPIQKMDSEVQCEIVSVSAVGSTLCTQSTRSVQSVLCTQNVTCERVFYIFTLQEWERFKLLHQRVLELHNLYDDAKNECYNHYKCHGSCFDGSCSSLLTFEDFKLLFELTLIQLSRNFSTILNYHVNLTILIN